MRFVKLILEYDGTHFCGFQKQSGTGLRTVQGTLEKLLSKLTGETIRVVAAGRTDAGVHAIGQVVSFATSTKIPLARIPIALNGLLPSDLAVVKAEEVNASFHARYNAHSKKYLYLIWNRENPPAILNNYCFYFPVLLNIEAMKEAAGYFSGSHDFYAFSASGSSVQTTVRRVFSCTVAAKEGFIMITVSANGFLYKMVRLMVGTLLEVGRERLEPSAVKKILESRRRGQGGPAVKPQGLYLVSVDYEEKFEDKRNSNPVSACLPLFKTFFLDT